MKIGLIALTKGGYILAETIAESHDSMTVLRKSKGQKVADLLNKEWTNFDGFICVMAAGIVVRSIAPLLGDKRSDPCVLVVDEKGTNVISLLSGHLGGGNALTLEISAILCANPVITTASDTLGLVALDLWAEANDLVPPPKETLSSISTKLVNEGSLKLFTDVEVASLPPGLQQVKRTDEADIIVSHSLYINSDCAFFRPRNIVIGSGCNRGTPVEEFESALVELLDDLNFSRSSIRNLASIDKKNDETGLLQFGADNDWRIDFFDKEAINTKNNLEISFAALKAVGAIGVAEPASLLSAKSNLLLSRKRKWKNITMAMAQVPFTLSAQDQVQQNR